MCCRNQKSSGIIGYYDNEVEVDLSWTLAKQFTDLFQYFSKSGRFDICSSFMTRYSNSMNIKYDSLLRNPETYLLKSEKFALEKTRFVNLFTID